MGQRADDRDGSRGVGRRALIRGAAAAGMAAWTAPAIIDSLASPAAAATVSGCFQVGVRLNQRVGSASTATWTSWTNGPQSMGTFIVPLGNCGSPACPGSVPFASASAAFLASLGAPTPANAPNGVNTVTVSVPAPCTVVGIGVSPAASLLGFPDCGQTSANGNAGRYGVAGIGTATVQMTPNGFIGIGNPSNGFWDSADDARSTITLSVSCP